MSLVVCYGPAMEETYRKSEGFRWCFVCRKRRQFDFVVMSPIEPSYYGPSPSIVGECGHLDGDLFPSMSGRLFGFTTGRWDDKMCMSTDVSTVAASGSLLVTVARVAKLHLIGKNGESSDG